MKRRMLALLLAVVMLIGMVPTSVFADAASPEDSVSVTEVEDSAVETEAPEEETEAPTEEETEAPTEAPAEPSEDEEETEAPAEETKAPTEEVVEEIEDLQADAGTANVYFTVSVEGVLGKTDDGQAAVELPVTVKDTDADGILTFHDALVALHDEYCVGGYTLQRGVTVTKLWGVDTYATDFFKNGEELTKMVAYKTSTVADDDQLYAVIMTDKSDRADCFTWFDKTAVTVKVGESFKLTLTGKSDDYAKSGATNIPVGTWEDGAFTQIGKTKTDFDGNVTLSFDKAGTYIVTAKGVLPGERWDDDLEWSDDIDCPTIAPYCVVTVEADEAPVTTAAVTFNFQQDGGQIAFAFDEEIPSNLAESYGYTDNVKDGVSALDVMVRAHELVFFDQFTPKNAKDFLDIGPTGFVIKYMAEDSINLCILVNGAQPTGSDGKSATIDYMKVEDGDYVFFGVYEDTAYYLDRYTWLETADGKPLNGQTFLANTDIDLVVMGNYAAYGAEGGPDAAVEDAQLAYMDMETGEVSAIRGKISDKDGKLTLHIPESMAGKTTCLLATGDELFGGLAVIKIGNVLRETDLPEVHVGIGGRTEDTVQELALSPEFLHSTMDYTVEPLTFVADEASRYLWVKVEYIPYCTAGFSFHGVAKTFTEAQNGHWVRLDKLVPGAEASVLTLTSSAVDGFDKTYTVTVSMDKGQAVLWKTDLKEEALTIGQNTEHTLSVEAGFTKDVAPDTAVHYQWYVNTTASAVGGKAVEGAVKADFTVPSGELGTFYYYAVASGDGLESAVSKVVEVTVKAVPKSITIVSDYPYTIPSNSANALAGVIFVAQHGDSFRFRAVDENGQDTPITWKVGSSWGGNFDAETGTYTVVSTSYSYLTAVSALDSNVTSGEKAVYVSYYKITSANQTVKLSEDGQKTVTAMVVAGNADLNGHVDWKVEMAPEGVAEVTSDPAAKTNRVNLNVLRPGTVKATMTLDAGPEGVEKLTDTGTITVTGVAVEDASGKLGKTYLELTGAPTMQLKAYTASDRTVASWSSADDSIVSVDENGLMTAHAVGSVIITATDSKGTKGGILVVVTDNGNPTFESLVLSGVSSKSNITYKADVHEYTGIQLSYYSTTTLTLTDKTLYNTDKLSGVASYKNMDGEDVSVPIASGKATALANLGFGTTDITLTLTDKEDASKSSVYKLQVTRVRDTGKTIAYSAGIAVQNAEGGALSNDLYLDKAEGYLFQATEAGVKNGTYTVSNSKYYYRAYLVNGRPDFTVNIKGTTAYTRIRYSIDDGQTWKELPQGGGLTDAISFPQAEGDAHAEVKVIFQIVGDQYYAENGFAFPEMTSNKEKLMVGSVQVGTAYTVWLEQLPNAGEPLILTASSDTGDWYPAFDPDTVAYKLSIPQESDLPTVTFTAAEGCTVKIGSKAAAADASGAYTLVLTTSNQTVTVTNADGSLTRKYTFAASKRVKNGADRVVDYLPINSQYTNGSAYGLSPESMLAGTFRSLGGFGGYATFYFADGITNDPTNKYGVDFYVYGNAYAGQSFAEPGQVWVSEDGSTWYALAGSEHYDSAIWDYTVTYTKDGTGTAWSDNYGHTQADHGRSFSWPLASNYPLNAQVNSSTITLSGILLPAVDGMVGGNTTSSYAHATTFGYADALVNGEENPYLANDDLSLKSAGFDLAWAVDTEGTPVNVDGMSFHYVKVVTASNIMAGAFNEKSTEVQRVYRASSTGSDVGTTAAPTAITFTQNGYTCTLTPEEGKQVYSMLLPMDAVSIHVDTEAENIYVNNQRIAADGATTEIPLKETGATLVRVIVQSGDQEPTIYLLKLTRQAGSDADMPQILTQPESAQYLVGDAIQDLTAEADTAGTFKNLTYQWFSNSTNSYEGAQAIPGATAAAYSLGKAEKSGTTYYFCTVTNKLGKDYSVSSDIAEISVKTEEEYLAEHIEGTGTEADPYQIAKAEDYTLIAGLVASGRSFAGKYLTQTEDITLPEGWQPMGVLIDPSVGNIGSGGKNMAPFSGHLNGLGHTLTVPEGGLPLLGYVKDAYVENLNIYGSRIEGYGLVNNLEGVGLSGNAITIEKVTLKSGTQTLKSGLIGTYITNNGFAGCSGGYLVTIRDCVAEEGVVIGYDGTQSKIGTFAGRFNGTIENCVSYAAVYGVDSVGGIVGNQDNSMTTFKVIGCEFHGTVEASGEEAGGIIGSGYIGGWADNAMRPNILNCTVTGSVTGSNKVGGIQGGDSIVIQTYARTPNEMTGNTFRGTVSAEGEAVGAIVGYYRGLNAYDRVHDNRCETPDANLRGIGQVAYVDTSAAVHETKLGLTYFDSSSGKFPSAPGYSWWQRNLNRSDDPLGADAASVCAFKGQPVLEDDGIQVVSGKSVTLKKVTVSDTGDEITSVTWALADPLDAMYATVTPAGVVKAKTVPTTRTVTFLGTLSGEYTGTVTQTVTILPLSTQVEIHEGGKNVTGQTLYMDVAAETARKLDGVIYPADAAQEMTWKSSNTKILTVAPDGTVSYVAGTGTVTVTATAADGSKKAASVKIQVGSLTQSVAIDAPASNLLRSGKSLTLKAVTEPVKPTVPGVTFQLVNSSDSAYATVTAAGKVTAKAVNEPHSVKIVAVSKDAAKVTSNTIELIILPKADSSIILKVGESYVTKTTLSRNVDSEIQLDAYTLNIADGKGEEVKADVTWKSSSAKVASVDASGKITCLKAGTATISALVNGKAQATVTVKVTSLVEHLEITSQTGLFTVASGKTLALKATVTEPAKPASKAVAWSVLDGSAYAKISSNGIVTANKNLTKPVTVTVQALAKDGSGVEVRQEVTILPIAQAVSVFAKDHERTTTTLVWDMAADPAVQLAAEVYPANADQNVTWKSSSAKIATVDQTGKVTCLKAGTVTITATAKDGSGKKASFQITVVKLMKDLSIEGGIIAGGKSLTLKSVITPIDTTNKKLTWSVSANDAGIKISSGKLTTKAVKEPVTVTVTATANDGSGVKAACDVTVYPATTKVTISVPGGGTIPATLEAGSSLELKATGSEGSANRFTWKTNNKLVTVVDGHVVADATAVGKTVTVTATAADGTGKSASIKLKITAPAAPEV